MACYCSGIAETNETMPQNVMGFWYYLWYEHQISTGGNPQKDVHWLSWV